MAVINDLTWDALRASLRPDSLKVLPADPAATPPVPARVVIDLSNLLGSPVSSLTDEGVTKAYATLLGAAATAQATVNQNQPVGERLAAFPAATVGATANGFVTMTRQITTRHELITATNIIGATA